MKMINTIERLTVAFFLLIFNCFSSQSLGDAVVSLDFGSGSNYGSALGTSITNLSYIAGEPAANGYYSIANNTVGMKSSMWHQLTEDHTPGDTNGYMMVVNAGTSAGDYFYTNTVSGLCVGTQYQFSAYVMNLFTSSSTDNSPPNLLFQVYDVTGTTLLNSYSTGLIYGGSATWMQKQLVFTATSTSVMIKIMNQSAGGAPGNDFVMDDITFSPYGATATVSVDSSSSTSLTACEGDSISHTFNSSLSSTTSTTQYQWQESTDNGTTWTDISGATSSSYTLSGTLSAGTYLFRMSFAENGNISTTSCRVVSNTITLTVNSIPSNVTYSLVQPQCYGDVASLTVSSPTGTDYTYSLDGTTYQSSTIFTPSAGTYTLYVKSTAGCSSAGIAITISNPAQTPTPTVTVSQPATCTASGSITVTETAYQYSFDGGTTWQTSNTITGLAAGTYSVKLRNVSLCESSAVSVTINSAPDAPVLSLESPQSKCPKTKIILDAGSGFDSYTWTFDGSTVGTSETLPVTTAGVYTITVTNSLGCSTSGSITVYDYDAPSVSLSIDNNTATIITNPTGTYTYSLDGSIWQDSNVFSNINNGSYSAYVKTSNGCIVSSSLFSIFFIPNVITPNNDGSNDAWEINGIENYPGSRIRIYDRYGIKVLDKTVGTSFQWDGKYNNRVLPTATYWYQINLTDGRYFNGCVVVKNRN